MKSKEDYFRSAAILTISQFWLLGQAPIQRSLLPLAHMLDWFTCVQYEDAIHFQHVD